MSLRAALTSFILLLAAAPELHAQAGPVPSTPQSSASYTSPPPPPVYPMPAPVYWVPPPRPPALDAADGERKPRWYGWQTLTVDAGVLAAGVALAASGDDTAPAGAAVLVGGYLLGAPIVHAGHGEWGMTFASLGTRAGAPFVGALLAVGVSDCGPSSEWCELGWAAIGGMFGIAAAIAIDAAAYAYERRPEPPRPRLGLAPTLLPTSARKAPAYGAAVYGTF